MPRKITVTIKDDFDPTLGADVTEAVEDFEQLLQVEFEGLIEVDEQDKPTPQGMKRVEVQVYWRHEDGKVFDVPKSMELSDVRDHIVSNVDGYFDFANSWMSEFDCWQIDDQDSRDEWGL